MSSTPWNLSPHLPRATDQADPIPCYPARIVREQIEEAECAQRERIEESCELNTPAIRVRAWERLHRLTLPREPAHAVLDVVADATRLTLEQVREEQRRRSELARSPPPRRFRGDHDANSGPMTYSDKRFFERSRRISCVHVPEASPDAAKH